MRARFANAGHILGSAFVELEIDAKPRPVRLVFSGDIGPYDKALQPDPARPWPADIALIESTYGDRQRLRMNETERRALLARELTDGLKAGGNVVMPVFAVERTQEILEDIALLKRSGRLSSVPVFLDSPLAGRVTEVFRKYRAHLTRSQDGHVFTGGDFRFSETVEQSKAIGAIRGGAVILAGSGMCEAGRVKHHLKDNLWRPDSTVIFVGYQAPGTLGAIIRNGAPQVRIHGEEIRVKARIRVIDAYSGHADRDDLVEWARPMFASLGTALLVHGEPEAASGLATGLACAGLDRARIAVPVLDQRFDFEFQQGRWIAKSSDSAAPRLAPPDVSAPRDWHNDYAQAILDLRTALNTAPDDRSRRHLLQELRRLLAENDRKSGRY